MDPVVTAGIVEDHPVVIEGITSWISADPEHRIQVVLVAHDLMALEPVTGPVADVLILDLELNGQLVTGQLPRLVAAGNRIVAFSAHSGPGLVRDVLDGGAYAYVAKDEGRDYLVEAVLAAAADRPCVTRSQAKAFLGDDGPERPSLSTQERQALLLWFQGMSKASVGRRMSITENTVRQYIDRARMKYAAVGRSALSKDALLARAIEDGIITPREVATYTSQARRPAERPLENGRPVG